MTVKTLHITAENHSKMLAEIRKLEKKFVSVFTFTKSNPDGGLETSSFDYFYNYCCSYYNFTAKIKLAD